MANEIQQKYRAAIAVMASNAAAADVMAAGAQTEVDNSHATTGGGNKARLEIDVTVAPSTATYIELYVEEGDATGVLSAPRLVAIFENVGTSADKYTAWVDDIAQFTEWTWKPIGYAVTAALSITLQLPEVQ